MLTYIIIVNDNGEMKSISQQEFEVKNDAKMMEDAINIVLDQRSLKEDRPVDRVFKPREPLRTDANGNTIPWDKEHDYFMAFDPSNPDLPTD